MPDRYLLVAFAAAAGALVALAPVPAIAAALLVALLLRRRVGPAALAVALLVLGVNAWRAHGSLAEASALHTRVAELLSPPSRCEGEGVVLASPVVLRAGRDGEASDGPPADGRVDVEIARGDCGGRALVAPLRARLYGAPPGLARGDRLAIVADIAAAHLFLNEGLRDPRPGIARSGIAASGGIVDVRVLGEGRSIGALVDRARNFVRSRIDATFHAEAAPLARALVLGEVDLAEDDSAAFRQSGLSHLLAVSGTHLVIAVVTLMSALRGLLRRIGPVAARHDTGRIAAALCVPAVWLYADFAGGGGSAVRASGMLTVAMLARAIGRRPSGVRSFAWSLLVPALIDPLVACDASFNLSAAATAGLLFLGEPVAAVVVRGEGAVRKVTGAIATTLAAMIACAPVIAMMAPTMPLLGVAANLVAAPIGEIAALPVCLAHACLAWVPAVEKGAAMLGSGALLLVRAIARVSGTDATALHVPQPTAAELAAIAVLIAAAWVAEDGRARRRAFIFGALALVALEMGAARDGAPHGVLRVSMLDVGQGDCIAIDLPDGSLMLVDGGGFVGSPVDPGERVILPYLRAKRRSRIDAVVLTHPHPDHFTGLASALPAIATGELWDTGEGEEHGAGATYDRLIRGVRARGVPIRRPADLCGKPRWFGGARVEVLAPCPSFDPDASANDNSLVIRIDFGARSVLLTGDAEEETEKKLLRDRPEALHADLLKVGHHGSRTSTSPAFLAAVSPGMAVISSGVRNRFGHPHPSTLATLEAQGVAVGRTDRGGEIVWETDGASVRVRRPGLE